MGDFPGWTFDGSSTNQAEGDASDCLLEPVRFVPDPIRGDGAFLVLCEVNSADGSPHPTNERARLRSVLAKGADGVEAWLGYEQEYTLYQGARPLGFPSERRFPAAQGPYYCGVGTDEVYGRDLVEYHLGACRAGLVVSGVNAEVMPGQWSFKLAEMFDATPLIASDHLWIARWLLYRVGEEMGVGDIEIQNRFQATGMAQVCTRTFPQRRCVRLEAWGRLRTALLQLEVESKSISLPTVLGMKCDSPVIMKPAVTMNSNTVFPIERLRFVSQRRLLLMASAISKTHRPNANADPYAVARVLLESVCGLAK